MAQQVGIMTFERPKAANRIKDGEYCLELTRMYLLDELPKNAESRCLAVASRIVKRELPEIRSLLAYSDLSQGHEGTIYKAAGWKHDRTTTPMSWKNRDGRKDIGSNTAKRRWRKTL